MRIAIVGGGAAGVATAWLLAPAHRVTLFEAAPQLGGHIRTVGGNVAPDGPAAEALDPAHPLEAGVVEFERSSFGHFTALMAALDVELRPVTLGTSLYRPDGAWHSPGVIRRSRRPRRWRLRALLDGAPLWAARQRFDRRVRRMAGRGRIDGPMADWLPQGPLGDWMRALMTYAWSVPFRETRAVPAGFALPVLRHFLCDRLDWVRIVGGVSAWIDRAVQQARALGADIRSRTPVHALRRCHYAIPNDSKHAMGAGDVIRGDSKHGRGVTGAIAVESSDGISHHDAVVIATSPGQIARLLADMDGDEVRRFGAWTDRSTHTLVHCDRAFFAAHGVVEPTAFDLFVDGGRGGYNALLDPLCGYPRDDAARYGLALGIDGHIDPRRVIHRQPHVVPRYTLDAFAQRAAVIAHNGHRDTWVAGAWLGDGLHEGAISSAARVADALGGRRLDLRR